MLSLCGRRARAIGLALATFWGGAAVAARAVAIPELNRLFTDDPNLPGRDLVFNNLMETLKLSDVHHAPRSSMMATTYAYLTEVVGRAQGEFHDRCREALEGTSLEQDQEFNLAIARYLKFRGAEVETHAVKYVDEDGELDRVEFRTHVLPMERGKSWPSRLAGYLDRLPRPVKLYVYPRLLEPTRFAEEFSDTAEGLAVGLSPLTILAFNASLTLEHEVFHALQMQGQAVGSNDVWPNHLIRCKEPALFHGVARYYVAQFGGFAIEEIGAATRDAVQDVLAVREEQLYRLGHDRDAPPAFLVERERRTALSFAKGAEWVYREALVRLKSGKIGRDDVRTVTRDNACEVRIDDRVSLTLARFEIDEHWADHVRAELGRGLAWIAAYRRFLVRPSHP